MLIDAHLHLLLAEGFAGGLIEQMDSTGIEKGLVMALPNEWVFMGSRCGGNEDVLKAVKEFGDRFIGGVYLDPREPDVLDTLHRYADEGFRAAKFHPTAGFYMDEPKFFPVYQELEKLGWPVTVHAGLTNIPYADSSKTTHSKFADPIYLDGVIRLFPKINWIIAHMGWPFFETTWGLAKFNENVYMDLSGPLAQINGLDKIAREGLGFDCGVDVFDRMVWGSDGVEIEEAFNRTQSKIIDMGRHEKIPSIFGQKITELLGLTY